MITAEEGSGALTRTDERVNGLGQGESEHLRCVSEPRCPFATEKAKAPQGVSVKPKL